MRQHLRSSFIVLRHCSSLDRCSERSAELGQQAAAGCEQVQDRGSESLPATKADPAIAGRALLVKELPKSLTAADRKALDVVVAELQADRLESALVQFRAWAATRDTCSARRRQTRRSGRSARASWARNEEVANAVDRVRFFDERNAASTTPLALLKGAVITKKPVLVARMVGPGST